MDNPRQPLRPRDAAPALGDRLPGLNRGGRGGADVLVEVAVQARLLASLGAGQLRRAARDGAEASLEKLIEPPGGGASSRLTGG